ncbi:MAG: hypothetical protein JOZ36_13865 [Acidobacteria bacterium]|nr:hypothetical protein [Acidobacteriota bacterium]
MIGAIKPESATAGSVYAKRTSHGTAKSSQFDAVVFGEYFDPFRSSRFFQRHRRTECKIVNVGAAVLCRKWLFQKDPQMATSSALFERRLNSVLT